RDRGGRPEEAPQDGSVADDAAIAVDLGRRGYALGERAEVRLATRPVELLTAGELHLDGEGIDPLPPLEERLGRVVDPLMPRYVEIVDAQEVRDLEDGVPVDEQATEDLLLGAIVERDLPVGRASLDGHETRQFRTGVRIQIGSPRRAGCAAEAPRARPTLGRAGCDRHVACPPSPPRFRPQFHGTREIWMKERPSIARARDGRGGFSRKPCR